MFRSDLNDDSNGEYHTLRGHGITTSEHVGDAKRDLGEMRRWISGTAYGAPRSAPTRVPMERRETIRPSRTVENEQVDTSPGVEQVAKRRRKSSINKISDI
jgi:hypothetical protein